MNTKHTPGLWTVSELYHKGEECSIAVHPCHFYYTGTIANLNKADAKLIAAAPDLLEALKTTVKGMCAICDECTTCDCNCAVVAQAKQTIVKAEGTE